MFQLPGAKRVRRDELHSPTSSPRSSPDPDLEELLRSKALTEFAYTTTAADDVAAGDAAAHSDEEETELRLFAAPSNAPSQTHKIRLSSPAADGGEPAILVKKPQSYYFADEPTSEEEAAFQAAAIDGKGVLELAKLPWPGCALPWKVRTISPAGMKREVLVGHPPMLATVEEKAHKRTRRSKKSRIAVRQKLQAAKEKESEQARLAQEKEEAEREKKTRRNREKKLKKKAKEQAKKAADGGSETVAGGAEANPADGPI
ncbi:hypothetical protein ACJQWK_02159 [Exserohilum turcicum]|uniref:Uncharacterized protein n=1 Tax=Exserohilum turcicum (strain 28A) TaxID=671987 RepID=R0IUY1_EXST2|nr:uncharacterized protein SETTUDRAFT_27257 [Exserohilum turcica Et28A]EOA88446.1 hypothetical protein SETTUDRAFT_27257 [Exserohilum turcica Et28A]